MTEKKQRIQKFLASQGVASRRAVERMIFEERICIDGDLATVGMLVSGTEDFVIDGKPFRPEKKETVWIAFHKPAGVECTMAPSSGSKTLADFDFGPTRVYPVGRLDKESRGLVLLTNDGQATLKMTHPRFEHEKEYWVTVDKPLTEEMIQKLSSGQIVIDGKKVNRCTVFPVSPQRFSILLKEGRNRQIRRMCGACGLTVRDLVRVRMGETELGALKAGEMKNIRIK